MGPLKSDYKKWLITVAVITVTAFTVIIFVDLTTITISPQRAENAYINSEFKHLLRKIEIRY